MSTGTTQPGHIADDLAVRSLIARIAQLADDGDLGDYVECFSPDARWEMPGSPRRGRVDIRTGAEARRAEGQTGPGSATRHLVSTMAVTVDGASARATSYWQYFTDTVDAPTLRLMGRYDDELIKVDDRWYLDRRLVTIG
jgi:3-phenylpropionate/cinnamic acid dioxygenase small subunit